MKNTLLLMIALGLTGCASTKQFLRPMNYRGVEQAKEQMKSQGYVPVLGSDESAFVVAGQDAQLYSTQLREYNLTKAQALDAQSAGESYRWPSRPETHGLAVVTPEDWFNRNMSSQNTTANIIDTLWNGLLVGGTYVAGDALDDQLSGKRDSDRRPEVTQNPDPSFTADAGGDIRANCISSGNFRAEGDISISNSSCEGK